MVRGVTKVISAQQVSGAIQDILSEYSREVAEAVRLEIDEIAVEGAKEIAEKSPEKSGHYGGGWGVVKAQGFTTTYTATIANLSKPSLTHLLEKGHAKSNGGRVEGKPHIGPVYDRIAKEAPLRIGKRIKGVR